MSNRAPVLVRILAVLALPVLLPIAAVAGLFQRPLVRTRSEVADILERYVQGEDNDAEWDDFTCVRIADPELEAIRVAIIRAEETDTLETQLLERYIRQLRRAEPADAGDAGLGMFSE